MYDDKRRIDTTRIPGVQEHREGRPMKLVTLTHNVKSSNNLTSVLRKHLPEFARAILKFPQRSKGY